MKTIGLIGGMSWESTMIYYQVINKTIQKDLGELHSAKLLLYSVDFQEIEACQSRGDWHKSGAILGEVAARLEQAGADYIVLCTNTMHKVVDQIQMQIDIPILHIADATAEEIRKHDYRTIGLLGTKYTMKESFYKDKINGYGIDVVVPGQEDIEIINRIIYDELCLGIIKESSKQEFLRIIATLEEQGIEGVILGCTEIGLLLKQEDTDLPLFDTTLIHAVCAAKYAVYDN